MSPAAVRVGLSLWIALSGAQVCAAETARVVDDKGVGFLIGGGVTAGLGVLMMASGAGALAEPCRFCAGSLSFGQIAAVTLLPIGFAHLAIGVPMLAVGGYRYRHAPPSVFLWLRPITPPMRRARVAMIVGASLAVPSAILAGYELFQTYGYDEAIAGGDYNERPSRLAWVGMGGFIAGVLTLVTAGAVYGVYRRDLRKVQRFDDEADGRALDVSVLPYVSRDGFGIQAAGRF